MSFLSSDNLGFYGIFDGHAGKRASQYAAENLYKYIVQIYPKGIAINFLITHIQ